jgi:hypothetical protein
MLKRFRLAVAAVAAALMLFVFGAIPAWANVTNYKVNSCAAGSFSYKVWWTESSSANRVTSWAPGNVYQAGATGKGTKWYLSDTFPAYAVETVASSGAYLGTFYPSDYTGTIVNC